MRNDSLERMWEAGPAVNEPSWRERSGRRRMRIFKGLELGKQFAGVVIDGFRFAGESFGASMPPRE